MKLTLLLFGLIMGAIGIGFSIVAGIINTAINLPQILQTTNSIPDSILIVTSLIKQIFNLGASLITAPLGILFFKNFYLDMKASAGKMR